MRFMKGERRKLRKQRRGGSVRCELCNFVDGFHAYRLKTFHYENDGIPLYTTKTSCLECGWWQAVDQVWIER